MFNPRPWLEVTEFVSLVVLLIGSTIAVVSGQVVYLAIPVTVCIALNIINRFRLRQNTRQRTTAALSKMYQQISESVKSLEQQIHSKSIRQNITSHSSKSSTELTQLQQTIASLQLQLNNRLNQIKNPDLETIYQSFEDIALLRESVTSLEKKYASLEKLLTSVNHPLANISLQERIEKLENTICQLTEQITIIYSYTEPINSREVSENEQNYTHEIDTSLETASQLILNETRLHQPLAVTSRLDPLPQNWQCEYSFTAHTDWVRSLTISPDGKTLASGSFDRNIKLWNLINGQLIKKFTAHASGIFSLAFSLDGQFIASGSFDHTIKIWNVKTGEIRHNLIAHSASVQCIAMSPNSPLLVSGSFDETVKLWQADTGELIDTLIDLGSPVNAIAFSLDGQIIATGGGDGTISLWQLTSENLWLSLGILRDNTSLIWSLAISPNSQIIACGSADGRITLWQLSSGNILGILEGHSGPVTSVIITPDGQTIISGSADGAIKFWNLETIKYIGTLTDEISTSVISIAISPDGKTLASGNSNGTVKIWLLE